MASCVSRCGRGLLRLAVWPGHRRSPPPQLTLVRASSERGTLFRVDRCRRGAGFPRIPALAARFSWVLLTGSVPRSLEEIWVLLACQAQAHKHKHRPRHKHRHSAITGTSTSTSTRTGTSTGTGTGHRHEHQPTHKHNHPHKPSASTRTSTSTSTSTITGASTSTGTSLPGRQHDGGARTSCRARVVVPIVRRRPRRACSDRDVGVRVVMTTPPNCAVVGVVVVVVVCCCCVCCCCLLWWWLLLLLCQSCYADIVVRAPIAPTETARVIVTPRNSAGVTRVQRRCCSAPSPRRLLPWADTTTASARRAGSPSPLRSSAADLDVGAPIVPSETA